MIFNGGKLKVLLCCWLTFVRNKEIAYAKEGGFIVKLQNYMETIVEDQLEKVLTAGEFCTCPSCQLDVKAITLNNLPPHYVVTDAGELYAKAEGFTIQHETDVVLQITAAAEIVKSKPRHKL